MAKHFEYDSIHISYEIHIPDNCNTIDGTAQLKGCTHSSRRNVIDGCWSFGYCHELTLSCRLDCLLQGMVVCIYTQYASEHSENKMAVESLLILNVLVVVIFFSLTRLKKRFYKNHVRNKFNR